MKRCPECGVRADDRVCPLCGVRMRELPAAAGAMQTHVHQESGERCGVSPNKTDRKPESPRPATTDAPVQQQSGWEYDSVRNAVKYIWKGIGIVMAFIIFLNACSVFL